MPFNSSGLRSLGVQAVNPPDTIFMKWDPTPNDYIMHDVGKLWYVDYGTTPATWSLWYLASKADMVATWLKIYPNGGGGGGGVLRSQDGLFEIADSTLIPPAINIIGGMPYNGDPLNPNDPYYININTTQRDIYSMYVNLNWSINQPSSNNTATEGMYSLGKINFLYALGTNNTMCGLGATNLGITTALATDNTSIGANSLHNLQTGAFCTALGSNSLPNNIVGSYLIGIGANAGLNLDINDASDILIGSPGKLGESNAIYIGQGGTGNAQQNKFYVPAIWEGFATPGLSTGLCIVNSAGLVYVDTIAPNCVLITDNTGNPVGIQGAAGTVYTGMGTGYPPQFLAFKPDSPTTPTVTTAIDPTTGAIILTAHAGGTAGVTNFTTDTSGPVTPNAGNVILKGGDMINTDGSVAHQVTISLNRGALGAVVAGTGISSAAEYTTLSSHDGSIVFDYSTPYVIDMVATGGGSSGIVSLTGDIGITCNQSTVNIQGGANILTNGISNVSPTSVLRVSLVDNISVVTATASGNITTTGGNFISSAGNLQLPFTTNLGAGVIAIGGISYFHQFGDSVTGSNVFVGALSGNFTLTPNTAIKNTGLGFSSLKSITTSVGNTALGYASSSLLEGGGGYNTATGLQSLNQLVSGSYNSVYGWQSGTNYNGSESHNVLLRNAGVSTTDNHVMRLGTDGVGNGQQNMAFMAGTYAAPRAGQAAFTSPQMMIMDIDGRMGTQAISPGEAQYFVTDSGTATVSGTTIQVLGGMNINTSGTSNVVTVHLDGSVQQNNTTAAGDGIYALGTIGATNYAANRFMHNYGTSSTWLGYQAGPITAPGTVSCVGIGTSALTSAAGAYNNVAIGANSMTLATSSNNCLCAGFNSGAALTTGSFNVFLGSNVGNACTSGSSNININSQPTTATTSNELRIGNATGVANGNLANDYIAGIYNTASGVAYLGTAPKMVAIGSDNKITSSPNIYMPTTTATEGQIIQNASTILHTFTQVGTGASNVFLGVNSGNVTTTAHGNVGVGCYTLTNMNTAASPNDAEQNVAVGAISMSNLQNGAYNTACGCQSLEFLVSGDCNTCIGNGSGYHYNAAESSNILIGHAVNGTGGESNVLRIGIGTGTGDGQVNKSYISGIRGITTGNANAIAVLIDSAGQLGTISSSIRHKENVKDISDISEIISHLRPVEFNYKQHKSTDIQYGLIAEEVADVWPEMIVYDKEGQPETVKYQYLPIILLKEIQNLRKRIETLESK